MDNLRLYQGKRVFITGHTGFKGTWLAKILVDAGAIITGYSLEPLDNESLYSLINLEGKMESIIGDIRDLKKLQAALDKAKPEIVFHLAAQPIVRESYRDPVYTYETNIMGTVNILEGIRNVSSVKSFVNITTDKVYFNNEQGVAFTEDMPLGGFDPYSNSKSCSELITDSYKNSFFKDRQIAISTVRAGNVIGGGDFSKDRIIPDCIRDTIQNKPIQVRNPYSIRPYQHVIEVLVVYLMIADKQIKDISFAGSYNVSPDEVNCITTGGLVDLFCNEWGENACWENKWEDNPPHEANLLMLNNTKLKNKFNWKPKWNIKDTVHYTVEFAKKQNNNDNIWDEMSRQINEYMEN